MKCEKEGEEKRRKGGQITGKLQLVHVRTRHSRNKCKIKKELLSVVSYAEDGNFLSFLCLAMSLWRREHLSFCGNISSAPRFTAAGRLLNSVSLSHNQSKDIIHLLEMSREAAGDAPPR